MAVGGVVVGKKKESRAKRSAGGFGMTGSGIAWLVESGDRFSRVDFCALEGGLGGFFFPFGVSGTVGWWVFALKESDLEIEGGGGGLWLVVLVSVDTGMGRGRREIVGRGEFCLVLCYM